MATHARIVRAPLLIKIEDLEDQARNAEPDIRFISRVSVASRPFDTSGKRSVWVEDIDGKGKECKLPHCIYDFLRGYLEFSGKTILCSFGGAHGALESMELHGQYFIEDFLIDDNPTVKSNASLQMLVDNSSKIEPLPNRLQITLNFVTFGEAMSGINQLNRY